MVALALVVALSLAAMHVLAPHIRFMRAIPRSRWLSFAGGAAVAYVFLYLLPGLSANQALVEQSLGAGLAFLENHIYLLALIGLVVFYGLDRLARASPAPEERPAAQRPSEAPVLFWVHIASFAAYNFLIGYLLLNLERPTRVALLFFGLAMGFHFLVNDYGLHCHYREDYDRWGRWLLVLAVLSGWLVGWRYRLPELGIALLFSFLGGGVILNVLKEELPVERESRFGTFVAGALIYALVLLIA